MIGRDREVGIGKEVGKEGKTMTDKRESGGSVLGLSKPGAAAVLGFVLMICGALLPFATNNLTAILLVVTTGFVTAVIGTVVTVYSR